MATDENRDEALETRLARLEAELKAARKRAYRMAWAPIAGAAAIAAIGCGIWALADDDRARIEAAATAAVADLPNFAGYPLRIEAGAETLTATGLVPSPTAKPALAKALEPVAKSEGLTLRLIVSAPPPVSALSATDQWAELKPFLQQEMGPLSVATADAAIRVADLEAALADREREIRDLTARLAAANDAHKAFAADIETRFKAFDREAAILSAEIAAGERMAERRADRLADALRRSTAELQVRTDELEAARLALGSKLDAADSALAADLQIRTAEIEVARTDLATKVADADAATSAGLETAIARQSASEARIEALEAAVGTAEATLQAAVTRQGEIAVRAKALEEAEFELTKAGAAAAEARARLADRAEALEARQAEIADRQAGLASTTAELAEARAAVRQAIDDVASAQSSLQARLDAAETAVAAKADAAASAAMAADIDKFSRSLDRLGEAATEARRAATTAVAGMDDVVAEATAISTRVESVADRTEAIAASVEALEADATLRAGAAARLEADVAAWRASVGDSAFKAAAKLTPTPPASLGTASGLNEDLSARLEAVESRAAEAIALLDDRIDRVAREAAEAQPRAASPIQAAGRELAAIRIRFASSAQPASAAEADQALAKVAEIALAMPAEAKLRIIGYADSDGTTEANRITSKRRSDWAYEKLASFGVPRDRMVSVGRGAERLLSPDASDDSPNRRVEFEAF